MKIFSWMQSKLNGKQETKKPNSIPANYQTLQEPRKEEFSDWPNGLLAIGTFGNNSLKEDPGRCNHLGSHSSQDHHPQDISPEEVVELQKELALLLHKQIPLESSPTEELETHNLQLDSFNLPSGLEDDRSNSDSVCGDSADKSGLLLRSSSCRGKDICADQKKKAMGKKSLTFLLKKMGMCRSAFAPAPSLRDPMPDKSTMEKILRAILHKKVYPQNSTTKATAKKYLETSHTHKTGDEDEMHDAASAGSKWVKTDSEYIVLEI